MTAILRRLAVLLVFLVATGLAVSAWFADRLRVSVDAMTTADHTATASIQKLALLQQLTEFARGGQEVGPLIAEYRLFSLVDRERDALTVLESQGGDQARDARRILLDAARYPEATDSLTIYTRDSRTHAWRLLAATAGGTVALGLALLLIAIAALGGQTAANGPVPPPAGPVSGGRRLILPAMSLIGLAAIALGVNFWLTLGAERRAEQAFDAWRAGVAYRDVRVDPIRLFERELKDSGVLRGLTDGLRHPTGAEALLLRTRRLEAALEDYESLLLSRAESEALARLRGLVSLNREVIESLAPGGRSPTEIDAAIGTRSWSAANPLEPLDDALLEGRVEHEARFLVNVHESTWNTRVAWPIALAGLGALILALPLLLLARRRYG